MKRNAIQKLITWKDNGDSRPVLLSGVKGAGKTYLALEFAKSFYEGHLYINFENNATIRNYLIEKSAKQDLGYDFVELLCQYYQIPEELIGNILIILDEIHSSNELTDLFLEYMKFEKAIPLIVISSAAIADEVDQNIFCNVTLFPMGFDEFLVALGHEWYAEVIKGHYQTNRRIPQIVHTELLTLFEDYLIVGGMPAAVNEYISTDETYNISEIHTGIFRNIDNVFQEGISESEAFKIKQILDVLVEQLNKENKKFQYRLIRKGATYAMYKEAIDRLAGQGYILKCNKSSFISLNDNMSFDKSLKEPTLEDPTQFKLYANDVGILNSLIEKQIIRTYKNEDLLRKTLIENYILQALAANGYTPSFWESNSQAKIDFIIKTSDGLVPLETKISENSRSKSISVFKTFFEIPYSIKISSRNYEFTNGIKYIPYYAIFCL